MVFCSQCGAKAKDGAKFCSSCGAPIKTASGPDTAASSSPAASAPSFNPDPPPSAAAPPPPGTFQVRLPHNVTPGQVMQVRVPAGFPQEGQLSQFRVPPGAKPGGLVHAPLPTNQGPGAGYSGAGYSGPPQGYGGGGYGGGGYGQPAYQQQNNRTGTGTALAAGAVGAVGGMFLADAMFDSGDCGDGGFGDW